ncbi:serine hydrolase domain-containing protein [Chryseobacterium sp. 3008163]|uniref:serine hydrolase domain-containing protein n=1 Tax=Chryseobacterium sp. 3008163 TaxID=2478663 RepID=UPI000F0CDB97|nr:serine hydrolase domain-containing protein [Chryseobacterium sp. 3008163]AYM99110.1 class A beta-lactamase-related serine hydrolase [Chryseobacterium sp. 3008163]
MKKITTVVLLSIFGNLAFGQNANTYSKEIQDKIKQVENNLVPWAMAQDSLKFSLEERMVQYKIPGLSIAVIKDYKIEWVKSYGWADIAQHRPVTTETLFQAASLSKSLNGVGVLKLVQDKKINLNDDINNYLKTWKFPYDSLSNNKKITTANLLSHTAGLTVHGFKGYPEGDSIPTLSEILDGKSPANSLAVRSMYEPGKKVEYSGGGTTISQLIVTDITQQKYEDYMWLQVLKPMGMNNSFFTQPPPPDKQNLLATGYNRYGEEMKEGKYNIYPEKAAAGLWTNPTDLAKYIIETQLSFQGKSGKVLSPEMTRLRLTPYLDSINAFGVYINKKGNEKYFQHSGSNEGFVCQYRGSLEYGNGVVVMVNSDNLGILNEIINSVAIVYKWADFYNPAVKKTITLTDDILKNYVGTYLLDGDTVSIVKKENGLWLNSSIQSKMYFTTELDFYITENKADYKFSKNLNGIINGYTVNGNKKAIRIK